MKYAPHYDGFAYWWFSDRANEGMGEGAIPPALFVRLAGGTLERSVAGRYYPTREEAIQALAQAEASK
jgi:hypothetical protein